MDLQGQRALVGGSSKGLGLAIATRLSELGATCVLLSRSEARLKHAKSLLPRPLDQEHDFTLADEDDVEITVRNVETKLPFDIFVHNSGGPSPSKILDSSWGEFQKALESHLRVGHLVAQKLLPYMMSRGRGKIVCVASTSVRSPIPGLATSNVCRAAVASWAKTLAGEVGKHQINVNVILPGFFQTDRLKEADEIALARLQKIPETVPLGRIGEPRELAEVVAFLASPSASYVTGAIIPVDGGRLNCL